MVCVPIETDERVLPRLAAELANDDTKKRSRPSRLKRSRRAEQDVSQGASTFTRIVAGDALRRLRPAERRLFILRYLNEHSPEEVMQAMAISRNKCWAVAFEGAAKGATNHGNVLT